MVLGLRAHDLTVDVARAGRIAPKALEAVERTGLGLEDVHDDVAEVHEVPGVVLTTLDGKGADALLAQLVLDLVDDGVDHTVVVARRDDEALGLSLIHISLPNL